MNTASSLADVGLPSGIGRVRRNVPLSSLCSWRIGGPADIVVEPDGTDAVRRLLEYVNQHGVPLVVIGAGSNILFDDAGLRGIVLRIGESLSGFDCDAGGVTALAGAWLPRMALAAAAAGLAGLEHLAGVPGTLGGSVAMNAGMPEAPIGGMVAWADAVDMAGNAVRFRGDECRFGYRTSRFLDGRHIVLGARLSCRGDDQAAVRARTTAVLKERRGKYPLDQPSAGSVFLRDPSRPAEYGPPGLLVEKAGLKGAREGGAVVSDRHANFIVNAGGATSADVLRLIRRIRLAVHGSTGYWLKCEIRYVAPDGSTRPADGAEGGTQT